MADDPSKKNPFIKLTRDERVWKEKRMDWVIDADADLKHTTRRESTRAYINRKANQKMIISEHLDAYKDLVTARLEATLNAFTPSHADVIIRAENPSFLLEEAVETAMMQRQKQLSQNGFIEHRDIQHRPHESHRLEWAVAAYLALNKSSENVDHLDEERRKLKDMLVSAIVEANKELPLLKKQPLAER